MNIQHNISKLKSIFPEVVNNGKVDFGRLEMLFGNNINIDNEKYGLSWAGKQKVFQEIQKTTTNTLNPDTFRSVNFEYTDNVFIEGENLEVLRILQKSYFNKIKLIYIDPPYNTGEDSFVFPDNFKESQDSYLKRSGEKNKEGFLKEEFLFRKNNRDNGKYHSVWLSMMYPRLYLARNLLKEDGVIFVSIDDNEVDNLKLIMDEIFGEENFLGRIIWHTATNNNASQISVEHEYVLGYAKNIENQEAWLIPSEKGKLINDKYAELRKKHRKNNKTIEKHLKNWIRQQIRENPGLLNGVSHYSYVDDFGVFYPGNSANTKPGGYDFDIIHPVTKKVCKKPEFGYRWPEKTFLEANKSGNVDWGKDETTIPRIKKRLETATEMLKSYYYEDNRKNTANLKKLFDNKRVFENPKSMGLLKMLFRFVIKDNDIVLDFFAGSGSTAQAVFELNRENDTNNSYICVQMAESINPKSIAGIAGFKTISELAIERLRKVCLSIENKNKEGFKIFKLATTNFKTWDEKIVSKTILEKQLSDFVNPLKSNDLLSVVWELLLKKGYSFETKIKQLEIDNTKLLLINENEAVFAFTKITEKAIDTIINMQPKLLLCLDLVFKGNEQLKYATKLNLDNHSIRFELV